MSDGNAQMTAPAQSPATRLDSEQWDMTSAITGRTYRVYVARPGADSPPPPEGYPVFYLSDGDFTFFTAADALMMLSAGRQAKPAIIVAVGYGEGLASAIRARFTDLTPTEPGDKMNAGLVGQSMFAGATYGEAEGFHRFMTEELRPLIDSLYPTDRNDNSYGGHSLGGLFGLHVLFNHPEAYRNYWIGTPSILWNDRVILQDEAKLVAALSAGTVAPRILFTVGGLEETVATDAQIPPGVTREQMEDMLKDAAPIGNTVSLAGRLEAVEGPAGYQVQLANIADETHISVLPAAICRGLRFALKP